MKKKTIIIIAVPVLLCVLGAVIFCSIFFRTESAASIAKKAWFEKAASANAAEQVSVLPSARQISHAETEFYAFFHFGVDTYTDTEIGTGKEDPAIFNPTSLDTDQWVRSVKAAGMKGAIITAKHHDGFCLWRTDYTEFSVKNSPYQGDVVAELAASCRKYGIKFGFYLSPFDENAPSFGKGEAYNDYVVNQLTELLTRYGDVFEVWFDGFISEEYKGRQTYDFDRWTETVRRYQPNAVTAIAPPIPDVAWVGNESGLADGNVNSVKYRKEQYVWAKSECDVSIRDGWFYHEEQNPKSLDSLMNIYYNSVGKNCTLLLNVPPDKSGRIDERDVKRLEEFGEEIAKIYAAPISAKVSVNGVFGQGQASIGTDDAAAYAFGDGEYFIDFTLDEATKIKTVVLSEDVNNYGERVEGFTVYVKRGNRYAKVGESESAGGKTIVTLDKARNSKSTEYRIVITKAKAAPVIRFIGLYI